MQEQQHESVPITEKQSLTSEKTPRRDRGYKWRFLLSSALLAVVIIGMPALLWNIKYKNRFHEIRYGVQITDSKTKTVSEQSRSGALAHMQLLRASWRDWAWTHRNLLMRMRSAQPGNNQVMEEVYNSLPLAPPDPSLTGTSNGTLSSQVGTGGVIFSWQPLGRLGTQTDALRSAADPIALVQQRKMERYAAALRRQNFARFRDIELSKTMSLGQAHLTLWVSGRVTESVLVRQYTPGTPAYAEAPVKQVLPPYDFLDTPKENRHD